MRKEKARAAVYARISKDRDETGLGVDRQVEDCRKLADLRKWEIDEKWVLVENDTSATSGPRPKFDRLVAGMETGQFDVVLVYRLDRLLRTMRDMARLYEVFNRTGTLLATADGQIDFSTEHGRASAILWGALAQIEIENIRGRVKRKVEENLDLGRPANGGSRPFGWQSDRKTQRPDEAKIIRELAARVIAGESLTSLCRDLDRRGVLTPGKVVKDVDGKVIGAKDQSRWTTPRLREMLARPRHAGIVTYKGEPRLDANDVEVKAQWEPILDRDTHERLKAALERRSFTPSGWTNRRHHLLSGILACAVCGQRLRVDHPTPKSGRNPYWTYRCRTHLARSRDPVDAYVLEQVRQRAAEHPIRIAEWESSEQEQLRDDIAAKKAKLAELERDFLTDDSPGQVARLARLTKELEAQIERLQTQRLDDIATITGNEFAEVDLGELLARSASLMPSDEKGESAKGELLEWQRSAIAMYVREILVHPTQRGRPFDPDAVEIRWADPNRLRWFGTVEAPNGTPAKLPGSRLKFTVEAVEHRKPEGR